MTQHSLFKDSVPLKKLELPLREAANILRGSPVDRTEWKSHILHLLFFKRICDVWDEDFVKALEHSNNTGYAREMANERVTIPVGAVLPGSFQFTREFTQFFVSCHRLATGDIYFDCRFGLGAVLLSFFHQ